MAHRWVLAILTVSGLLPALGQTSDAPMTSAQKYRLFVKETMAPSALFTAALGAGISHATQGFPDYGQGSRPLRQRMGAALMDSASQNFFSDAVLASALHQDPRYSARARNRTFSPASVTP